jgi:hypothetical protein
MLYILLFSNFNHLSEVFVDEFQTLIKATNYRKHMKKSKGNSPWAKRSPHVKEDITLPNFSTWASTWEEVSRPSKFSSNLQSVIIHFSKGQPVIFPW